MLKSAQSELNSTLLGVQHCVNKRNKHRNEWAAKAVYKNKLTHKIQGFTLMELLLVMAVFAILVAIALPRYTEFVAQQKVSQVTQQLRDHLQLARTYAQTHQNSVQVCPVSQVNLNSSLPTCESGAIMNAWSAWVVLEISSENLPTKVIARSDALADVVITGATRPLEFNRQGTGTNDTLMIRSTSLPNISSRIVISLEGRVR